MLGSTEDQTRLVVENCDDFAHYIEQGTKQPSSRSFHVTGLCTTWISALHEESHPRRVKTSGVRTGLRGASMVKIRQR